MDTHGPGDTPDELERLAEDWIALWQSEISALAADREVMEGWAAWATQCATAAAGWMRAAMTPPHMPAASPGAQQPPGGFPHLFAMPPFMSFPVPPGMQSWPTGWPPPPPPAQAGAHEPAPSPAGPSPAPAPSQPGTDAQHDSGDGAALRQRMEQLEQRLASLERGAGGTAKNPRRPRRRPPQP